MGQFSVEISGLPGSDLSGNQHMNHTEKHPAPAGTDGRGAEFAPAKKLNQYNRNRVANLCMIVRILPEGEPFLVGGRAAQTLTLLLEVGDKGFNSGAVLRHMCSC